MVRKRGEIRYHFPRNKRKNATREDANRNRKQGKGEGEERYPPPPTRRTTIHARTREGLVVPGVAVVEVHVLGIAEESEVDGDEGLGRLRDERSFHDDTGIRERQRDERESYTRVMCALDRRARVSN